MSCMAITESSSFCSLKVLAMSIVYSGLNSANIINILQFRLVFMRWIVDVSQNMENGRRKIFNDEVI